MVDRARFHVENLHSQIADDLIRQIATGAYAAGTPLPSDADLSKLYGIAPNTLRRALDHLAELQLIDRRKGRATTVTDLEEWRRITRLISTVDGNGNRVLGEFEQRNARIEMPPEAISATLGQKISRAVLRFDRLRTYRGRCFMVEDVYVPIRQEDLRGCQEHLDRLARDIWWNREVAQTKRERLWLEEAREADREPLNLSRGQTVLCIERILFGTRQQPLEYRIGRCNLGHDLFYVSD